MHLNHPTISIGKFMNPKSDTMCFAIFTLATTMTFSVSAHAHSIQLNELVVTAKGYESDTLDTPSATETLNTDKASASKTAQPQGAIASLAALSLMDRVEVIKDPGSVLHGTGARHPVKPL
jgi:hemoglobin/transferrin/lactoferrin receptor protein